MRRNAYNLSNDLSRISSALSRAMLGSASDDAAIALANYRDAQTEGQNLKNRGMSGNLDAIDAAAQGNILRKGVANALGFDLNNGNLIQPVLPGDPQRSVPAFGADQVNMDSGATLTELGNIARTIYGDGTSNANQLSQMLNNLGAAGSNRLAESMILKGTDDQAGRGALLMSPSGGKFQNPKNARAEIANALTASMDKNKKTLEGKLDETEARYKPGGQGDRDKAADNLTEKAIAGDLTAAKERWNNYKANTVKSSTDYKTRVDAGVAKEKNRLADATVRYKHDNRTVEFTVEPGKIIVVDPVSAEKAGIKIQTEGEYKGLYILDGGEKPGDVQVTVGKGDVHISEFMANKLGIEPNADGQYIIPGAGFEKDASTRGGGSVGFAVSPSDDKALRDFVDEADTKNVIDGMSNAATIVNQLVNASVSAMGAKKSIPKAKAFITQKLSRGFTEFEVPNSGVIYDDTFNVPNFLLDELNATTGNVENDKAIRALKANQPDKFLNSITALFNQYGFSAEQIAIILG